jgi:hypothetical protein
LTRSEIEQAVARVTGESRQVIRRYGFSIVSEEPESPTDPSLVLDCPGCGVRLDVNDVSNPQLDELECPRCDAVYPFVVDELYVTDAPKRAFAACA